MNNDVLGQADRHDLIERYNYRSLCDSRPPPPRNIYHFTESYMANLCPFDQDRIRNALWLTEFDWKRNGSKARKRISFKVEKNFPRTVEQEWRWREVSSKRSTLEPTPSQLEIKAQTESEMAVEYKLGSKKNPPKIIPTTNYFRINQIRLLRIIVCCLAIVNYFQGFQGFYNIVLRSIYLENPLSEDYSVCGDPYYPGDMIWEFPSFIFHVPYSACLLYLDTKYTAYLCVGYPFFQFIFLFFRTNRDYMQMVWVAYEDEDFEKVLNTEFAWGVAFDIGFSMILLYWFYVIHDNKMLFMREMKRSMMREINRELDAKYLNRIRLRRKIVRQAGRIQKGRVIRKLLYTKGRSILHPREEEVILEFSEGMNRYRVLCGAEWIRMLNIPQGYTVDNQNIVPWVLSPDTPPPEPAPKRFSWSDMWRPPYKYKEPMAPPILIMVHDNPFYKFEKPRFARYRDHLMLVYKSEDWLKNKRKSIHLVWSTGSFTWDQKRHT